MSQLKTSPTMPLFPGIGDVSLGVAMSSNMRLSLQQDVGAINACIDHYNQAQNHADKLACLGRIQEQAQYMQDRYKADVYTQLPAFEQEIHHRLFRELTSHQMLLDPTYCPYHFDSVESLVTRMSPEKVSQMLAILSSPFLNKKGDKPALENLYTAQDNPDEKQAFEQFLSTHSITILSGGNARNFKVTRLVDNNIQILKLDNRLDMPKLAERALRKILPQTISPVYAERQATFVHGKLHKKMTCSLLVTRYYPGENVESYAKSLKQDTPRRLQKALDLFSDMADILLKMQQAKFAFPDAKNTNWLIDEQGQLQLADTKSFINTNQQMRVDRSTISGLIRTGYLCPPETSHTIFSADAMHSYLWGRNLYQFLTCCDVNTLKQSHQAFAYSNPIFTTLQGHLLQQLIMESIDEEPSCRMPINRICHSLKLIKQLGKLTQAREYADVFYLIKDPAKKTDYYHMIQPTLRSVVHTIEDMITLLQALDDIHKEDFLTTLAPDLPGLLIPDQVITDTISMLNQLPATEHGKLLKIITPEILIQNCSANGLIEIYNNLSDDTQDWFFDAIKSTLIDNIDTIDDLITLLSPLKDTQQQEILILIKDKLPQILPQDNILSNSHLLLSCLHNTCHAQILDLIDFEALKTHRELIARQDIISILNTLQEPDSVRFYISIEPVLLTKIQNIKDACMIMPSLDSTCLEKCLQALGEDLRKISTTGDFIENITALLDALPSEQHPLLMKYLDISSIVNHIDSLETLLHRNPHALKTLDQAMQGHYGQLIQSLDDFIRVLDCYPDMTCRKHVYKEMVHNTAGQNISDFMQNAHDFVTISAKLSDRGIISLCKIKSYTDLVHDDADFNQIEQAIKSNIFHLARTFADFMSIMRHLPPDKGLSFLRDNQSKLHLFLSTGDEVLSLLQYTHQHEEIKESATDLVIDVIVDKLPHIDFNLQQLTELLRLMSDEDHLSSLLPVLNFKDVVHSIDDLTHLYESIRENATDLSNADAMCFFALGSRMIELIPNQALFAQQSHRFSNQFCEAVLSCYEPLEKIEKSEHLFEFLGSAPDITWRDAVFTNRISHIHEYIQSVDELLQLCGYLSEPRQNECLRTVLQYAPQWLEDQGAFVRLISSLNETQRDLAMPMLKPQLLRITTTPKFLEDIKPYLDKHPDIVSHLSANVYKTALKAMDSRSPEVIPTQTPHQ